VLIWNSIPSASGTDANVVLGQAVFSGEMSNRGGAIDASTLNYPVGVACAGNKLMVLDSQNYRVLIWNSFPTTNGQAANVVVGQAVMTTANPASQAGATDYLYPLGIASDGTRLFVGDNWRVLIYDHIPTANGAAADQVLGADDLTAWPNVQGVNGFGNYVLPVAIPGGLAVVDASGNRVLRFTPLPATSGADATSVVGQPNFSRLEAGGAGLFDEYAFRMQNSIRGAASDGTWLFVSDYGNHRVVMVPAHSE
jgi:hypothetical protein